MPEPVVDKGKCLVYTIYKECRYKDWIVVPGEKIRKAKKIILSKNLYQLHDPFSKDEIAKYLWLGVLIGTQQETALL